MKTLIIIALAMFALGHTDAMAQQKAATPVVYSCPMHAK
jgi:hypothetical protein